MSKFPNPPLYVVLAEMAERLKPMIDTAHKDGRIGDMCELHWAVSMLERDKRDARAKR